MQSTRVLLCLIISLGFPACAYGQSSVPERARVATSPEEVVAYLTATRFKGIRLTADQKEKIRTVILESLERGKALDFSKPDWQERREQIRRDREAAMRGVLTNDADRAIFDAIAKNS